MDDSDYGDPTGKERIVNIVRKSLEKTSSKGTFDDAMQEQARRRLSALRNQMLLRIQLLLLRT